MVSYNASLLLGVQILAQGSFDEGTGRIWLENVTCMGSERGLIDCIDDLEGNSSCTHAQDAGVRCPSGICVSS